MVVNKGLIHVYTGEGKGKTTAALGMAMRAAGWGWKVLIIQFLKSGNSGEKKFIKRTQSLELRTKNLKVTTEQDKPIIEIESFGKDEFVDPKRLTEKDFEETGKAMERWKMEMEENPPSSRLNRDFGEAKWDMIILDEINVAIKFGLTPLSLVLDLIRKKPKNLELVLTGRWVHPLIIKLADYVTEIKEIKHPYQKKISARAGIEY